MTQTTTQTTTRTAATVRAELQALQHRARRYDDGYNEGGEGYNPHRASVRALEAEYDRLAEAEADLAYDAKLAAEDAEWTRELTIARRAAWNTWVTAQGTQVRPAALTQYYQQAGYDMATLRRQITRHGL